MYCSKSHVDIQLHTQYFKIPFWETRLSATFFSLTHPPPTPPLSTLFPSLSPSPLVTFVPLLPSPSPPSLSFSPILSLSLSLLTKCTEHWDLIGSCCSSNVHQETVNRALRILVQLLSNSTLFQRFHEGDIFGGWVYGFDTSPEMCELLESSTVNFNPLRRSVHSPSWPGRLCCLNFCPVTLSLHKSTS